MLWTDFSSLVLGKIGQFEETLQRYINSKKFEFSINMVAEIKSVLTEGGLGNSF